MDTYIIYIYIYDVSVHAAPRQPPSGVRLTVIEEDTALVSWREPTEPNVVVTHYTILYATQKSWLAGHWQVLQREGESESSLYTHTHTQSSPGFLTSAASLRPLTGSHTMALLEKLEPGNVYLVKIAASNQVGDGPFSGLVELPLRHGNNHRSKNPRHSDTLPDPAGRQSDTLQSWW